VALHTSGRPIELFFKTRRRRRATLESNACKAYAASIITRRTKAVHVRTHVGRCPSVDPPECVYSRMISAAVVLKLAGRVAFMGLQGSGWRVEDARTCRTNTFGFVFFTRYKVTSQSYYNNLYGYARIQRLMYNIAIISYRINIKLSTEKKKQTCHIENFEQYNITQRRIGEKQLAEIFVRPPGKSQKIVRT